MSRRRGFPTALGRLLRKASGPQKVKLALAVMQAWPVAAGSTIAAHLCAVRFQASVLWVLADQAVWGHQLGFLRQDLLARLADLLGPGIVTDIRLAAFGPSPGSGGPPLPRPANRPAVGPRPDLSPQEQEEICRQAAQLIAKPALAQRFAALQIAARKHQAPKPRPR